MFVTILFATLLVVSSCGSNSGLNGTFALSNSNGLRLFDAHQWPEFYGEPIAALTFSGNRFELTAMVNVDFGTEVETFPRLIAGTSSWIDKTTVEINRRGWTVGNGVTTGRYSVSDNQIEFINDNGHVAVFDFNSTENTLTFTDIGGNIFRFTRFTDIRDNTISSSATPPEELVVAQGSPTVIDEIVSGIAGALQDLFTRARTIESPEGTWHTAVREETEGEEEYNIRVLQILETGNFPQFADEPLMAMTLYDGDFDFTALGSGVGGIPPWIDHISRRELFVFLNRNVDKYSWEWERLTYNFPEYMYPDGDGGNLDKWRGVISGSYTISEYLAEQDDDRELDGIIEFVFNAGYIFSFEYVIIDGIFTLFHTEEDFIFVRQ